MKTLTKNQKDIKEMFDILNTKNISAKKYDDMLQKINTFAVAKFESTFLKQLVINELSMFR